jgi:polyphosphate kinase
VYYFSNGGDEQVYLASADWMSRNLDKRIELMFPVDNPDHKATVIYALRAMFRDNVKARCLLADGGYERKRAASGEPPFRVQQHLQDDVRRRNALARERAGVTFSPERADRRSVRRET